MSSERKPSRRKFLAGFAASASALVLSGCKQLDQVGRQGGWFRDNVLHLGEDLNQTVQRFFLHPTSLAREFPASEISTKFKANGSTDPDDPAYRALAANGFADWKLKVGGLVEMRMEFSLADLRALPAREQITRHDCVEGWSCIGQWKGVPLAHILNMVRLKPTARYILFTCADELEKTLDGSGRYYETHGLEDAFHPQTILAYDMNGATLTVPHGAPLRLRTERTLGYKMAKYVMSIDAIDDFSTISRGNGGFWEDRGYDWYAGI
jgi:DMSO/TMAO reductase YedYZ molybdopterin-dependent catalytic subunit